MTRQEALDAYGPLNEAGVIQGPGKFEGETLYAPVFWEASGDGSADLMEWPDDTTTYLVGIDDSDRAEFPELSADTVAVHMQENDVGFVCCEELNAEQLAKLESENAAEWESNYPEAADEG